MVHLRHNRMWRKFNLAEQARGSSAGTVSCTNACSPDIACSPSTFAVTNSPDYGDSFPKARRDCDDSNSVADLDHQRQCRRELVCQWNQLR